MILRNGHILRFSLIVFLALIFTATSCTNQQNNDTSDSEPQVFTKAMQDTISPDQALQRLQNGNARFVDGKLKYKDYREQFEQTAAGQYPHSTVLTCIDSRSGAEQFFDVSIGEIFNTRVAGNVVNEDVLGSMEFATAVAGSKLIAVVGHSNCGAVKGAIDNAELGHLTGLVKKIKPAIDQVSDTLQPRTSDNKEFVNAVTREHVERVIDQILSRSDVIQKQVEAGEIKIVGGTHNLATGEVTFFDM